MLVEHVHGNYFQELLLTMQVKCDEVDGMSQAQHMVYLYTQDPANIAIAQDFGLLL